MLAALAALGVWLALGRPRLECVAALALAAVPAVVVAAWALLGSVVARGRAARRRSGERTARSSASLVVVGVAGVVVGGASARAPRPADPGGAGSGARLARGRVAAAVAVLAVLVAADLGRAWDDFRNPPAEQVTTGAARVAEVSSNHRWTWWTQAWELFRRSPWGGWGAGTFELARRPIREDSIAPLDPHDLAARRAGGDGRRRLSLLLAALAGAGWVAAAGVSRLRDDDRAAAVALAARRRGLARPLARGHAVAVRGGHRAGALRARRARRGGPAARSAVARPPGLAAVAVAAGSLAVAVSIAAPAVAERKTDAAFEALLEGDPDGAVDGANDARSLDPLSVEPVIVQATAEEIRGDLDEAERLYRHAVELQPRNPRPWYELGRFEFESRRGGSSPPSSTPTARTRSTRGPRRPASCSTRSARRWRRGWTRTSARRGPARRARRGAAAA